MNDLDLVEQYFQRELTESEEQALDELLESSPEAAELFQEKAKAAYLRYGLPQPTLPPKAPPGGHSPASFKWIWALVGAGLLAGAAWLWIRNQGFQWPWNSPEPTPVTAPAHPKAASPAKPDRNPVSSSAGVAPATDNAGTDRDLAPGDSTPEDKVDSAVIPALVTPLAQPNPAGDNQGHPGLRVIVERPLPGLVTVSVLDTTGKEIRMLYAGVLQAGRWAFEWNGRLADGSRATIGTYTIQVQSGSTVQKQKVWIDK